MCLCFFSPSIDQLAEVVRHHIESNDRLQNDLVLVGEVLQFFFLDKEFNIQQMFIEGSYCRIRFRLFFQTSQWTSTPFFYSSGM